MTKNIDAPNKLKSPKKVTKLVILNAGAPHHITQKFGQKLSQLALEHGEDRIDWLVMASGLKASDVTIVSGYQLEKTRKTPGKTHIVSNKNWQTTGSAGSLLCVNLEDVSDLLVCYGDILFRERIVHQLRNVNGEISVAWDSRFRTRYSDRPLDDLDRCEKVIESNGLLKSLGKDLPTNWTSGEFIGLVRFSGSVLEVLANLTQSQKNMLAPLSLVDLVEWLRIQGHIVHGCDVLGDWAELNETHDIARFVLGTKAESLARLKKVVKKSIIQPQVSFSVGSWMRDPKQTVAQIREIFKNDRIIVRSSAKSEDSFQHSNAGAYTSLLNIDPSGNLHDVINEVCESYKNKQLDDQVLVQPMVADVIMSGVIFTRTLDFGAPYYIINYSESSDTEIITSGKAGENVTYIIRRDIDIDTIEERHLQLLLQAVREIEALLNYDALDIEFAVDTPLNIHILQVRPITVANSDAALTASCLSMVDRAREKWGRHFTPRPQIKGSLPIYGVMPDWNPAEIIGTNAGRLAASLYRYLITDDIWSQQRAEYGYKDIRPQPLLVNFCGKNYIDVRASFNSFIPKSVCESLQERLVEYYLTRLRENPEFHDKVEFKILPTCLSFGTKTWSDRLLKTGKFDANDIGELEIGLLEISQNAILRTREDLAAAEKFAAQFDNSYASEDSFGLERARRLLEECRLTGTLPFAHLARSGFIAITLLQEAVEQGKLSVAAKDAFLTSIRTVSHEIMFDAERVALGSLDWIEFVSIYGHLRPGTYEIQSLAYSEDPERYLRPIVGQMGQASPVAHDIKPWEYEKSAFFAAMADLGIKGSAEELEEFLRTAIEGREKSKFIFSRYLSAALKDISDWGETYGLTRDELSHLSIDELTEVCDSVVPVEKQVCVLKEVSSRARKISKVSAACQLPELLVKLQNFDIFRLRDGQPNFIGATSVQARCVVLGGSNSDNEMTLQGSIVMIPQADPGFDWLFGQNIGGLITMYGGTNSHMAIRAAEFGLPAAIGIGEKMYDALAGARILELDPRNKILRSVG